MNQQTLQKVREQVEAQEKQEFRNTMKSKMKDRIDNRSLPTYAKVNNKNVIECQICRFTTKDQLTFFNHVKTKKHQSAVEQLNRAQSQPQPQSKAQASGGVVNGKRDAPYELYVDSEDIKEAEDKNKPQKPQPGPSLVSYQDDDEDEEDVGPALPAQKDKDLSGKNDNQKMEEDAGVEENKEEEMVVEKPTALPQGFFDKKEDIEERKKRQEIEKTIENYKSFMEEIKDVAKNEADEILKEMDGKEAPPLEEAEQEILNKVIKEDENEIEDAQDYISNLRKRMAARGKGGSQAGGQDKDANVEKKGRKDKMESEDQEGVGFGWKKKGLF